MKASIYLSVILLTSLLLVMTACNKDKMPDEDKDWNVLEWTVDGEKYKATCNTGTIISGCDPVDCQYYHDTKTLEFIGSGENGAVKVYKFKSLIITGQNNDFKQYDKLNFRSRYSDDSCIVHSLDKNSKYNFIINKVDTVYKYIEGEYSFTGINDCQDTVRVKDGYFKLSY